MVAKSGVLAKVEDDIVEHLKVTKEKGSGIVYCMKKATVEGVTLALRRAGFTAAAFHSGVKVSEKDKVLNDWLQGHTQVMVAAGK